MADRVQALLGEIEDHLQHLPATTDAAGGRELVAAVRDALRELSSLVSARRWPRVVRGGLPPGATFLLLTEEESTALLADIQDANADLRDRLAFAEAQLLACREHLHAATTADEAGVAAAALLLRTADFTAEQRAAVSTLLAAAAAGGPTSDALGRLLAHADETFGPVAEEDRAAAAALLDELDGRQATREPKPDDADEEGPLGRRRRHEIDR